MRSIPAAFDGSHSAQSALGFVLDPARAHHARLHLPGIVGPPDFADDVETEAWIEPSQLRLRDLLRQVAQKSAEAGVACMPEVVVGRQVIGYADCAITALRPKVPRGQ